jgi:hypothetical protein
MPLRIKVEPRWVDELLAYLRGLGADARKERRNAIVVRRRHKRLAGEPAYQDKMELEFIVRGWAHRRPDAHYRIDEAA